MVTEDWTHLNELLDKRFKELHSNIIEKAATSTREIALLDGKIEVLAARLEVAESEIADHETYISEEGGGDDT